MSRTVIISQNSDILNHPSTQTLHTYENGDILVTTDAPISESGKSDEISVQQGVILPNSANAQRRIAPKSISQSISQSISRSIEQIEDTKEINAYIELIGPPDPTWMTRLNELGIELLQFQPANSYLSRATKAALQEAHHQPFVLNIIPIHDAIKPGTIVSESGEEEVCIVVEGDRASAPAIIQDLSSLPEVTIDPNQQIDVVGFYVRIHATVTAIGQDALLRHPKVFAVEPYIAPQLEDEVAGLIIAGQYDTFGKPNGSYLRWLEDQGLNGAEVTIGIVDAGVDSSHPAFGDRIKDLSFGQKSWHGTFVAGHAAGCYLAEQDNNQFIYGLGMAPKANLLIQSNQNTATTVCKETVTETVAGFAGTIQNNSWGSGTSDPMTYGSLEATYDKLVRNADPDSPIPKPLTICFSSGNSGSAGLTRPKAAKNLIVTGNSETYRPDVGKDQSDNINEIYTGPRSSSHGNCGDGRIVPHLVAPGEWTASANYDSRPGEREYISPKLTWGGGSSGASPKTAGACALLTQWWRRHNHGADPSPALLKALLVNGAEPIQAGGAIPNKLQGWGRLNLQNVLSDDVRHVYVDQSILLTHRGEQKTWSIRVTDSLQPVKITLCWTDPPAAIGSGTAQASAIVNKLALRANVNGTLYRANQFQNGWSYPAGSPDREGWDNLQNIYLSGGSLPNTLQVSVTALDLTTNCLTGRISPPQQDFALVITNGSLDQGSTPAQVFVAIDPVVADPVTTDPTSQPAKPSQNDNFWNNTENQDANDLDQVWWNTIRPSNSPVLPTPTPNPVSNSTKADLWWLQSDVWWKKSESEQEENNSDSLIQSIQTASTAAIIGSQYIEKNHIITVNCNISESLRERDHTSVEPTLIEHVSEIDRASSELASQGGIPFSQALSQLMQHWHSLNAANSNTQRVSVLVVRSTTRISRTDLAVLRRLAFMGQLYLVSDNAQILAFLAQRIHRASGLQLRLASNPRALDALVHDTLMEASGAQQADVDQMSEPMLNAIVTHHLFQVVSTDRHLTIQIQFPPFVIPDLQLIGPDRSSIPIDFTSNFTSNFTSDSTSDLTTSTSPVTVTQKPGLLQLDVNAEQCSSWAGQWTLLLKQPGQENLSRVRVWVWSALQWQFRQQETAIQAESDRDQNEMLIAVSGSSASLSRLQSQPRIISTDGITQESDRSLDVQVELPRSDGRPEVAGVIEESQRANHAPTLSAPTPYAPTLSALIRTPRLNAGATLIDLPMRVEGVDALGYPFVRLLRSSFIQLEPRSTWRQRLTESPLTAESPVILTPAHIAAVHFEDNELTGLTLKRGEHTRRVIMTSPKLRQQLTRAFQRRFPNQELIVGVVGDELHGIYCPLQYSRLPYKHTRPFVQTQA